MAKDIESQLAVHTQLLEQSRDDIREIKSLLAGDYEHPGLVVRTDRLEQAQKRVTRFVWIGLASLIGLIANALSSFLGMK